MAMIFLRHLLLNPQFEKRGRRTVLKTGCVYQGVYTFMLETAIKSVNNDNDNNNSNNNNNNDNKRKDLVLIQERSISSRYKR